MNQFKLKYPLFLILFLVFSLLFEHRANAASLSLIPSASTVSVGNIFSVKVVVGTEEKVINNAESIIQFPTDLLETVSIDNSSSIFSLWVEQPTFSNSIGQITFNGGVPNPGFKGNSGKIISVTFRTKKVGTASIFFSNSAVRENDGLGTDILINKNGTSISISGSADTKTTDKKVPVPVEEVDNTSSNTSADTTSNVPSDSLPMITSSTHPDQAKWYSENNAEFSWELPAKALEVRTSISKSSSATPTVSYKPPINHKKVSDLADGTFYFNLQTKTTSGWSKVAHYRINIDTSPPEPFQIAFPHGKKSIEPQSVILFNTKDKISGMDHYDIKVGEGGPNLPVPSTLSNPYILPAQYPGKHLVTVIAYDHAGNSATAFNEYEVDALESPKITYYTEEIDSGDIVKIRGTTYPDSDLTVTIRNGKEVVSEEYTKSNSSGDFSLVLSKRLEKGVYNFTVRVINQRGAKSNETEPLSIIIKSKFTAELMTLIVNYLSIFVLIILALSSVFLFTVYMWNKFIRTIRKLRYESKDAERTLEKSFKLLRGDVEQHISLLRKAEKKRKLTGEEISFLEKFESNLEEAEEIVTQKMHDIGED